MLSFVRLAGVNIFENDDNISEGGVSISFFFPFLQRIFERKKLSKDEELQRLS